MTVLKQLWNNLFHPRKSSMYRFQKITTTIMYVFLLTAIVTLCLSPSTLISFYTKNPSLSSIFVPIMVIFYFFVIACFIFVAITMLACLGFLIKKTLQRRLSFQHVWSLTANAITWPTVILAVIETIYSLPPLFFSAYILICIIILASMIQAVPKPKPRTIKRSGRPV
ncbi:uncharacterized protein DUF1189 [Scopulibacillus darangshiensis]|uniref:Uncharacterized protein DUF1189 n=1 Tax=Scopulibacillus darangshiensis TaxID=442528 RepID=A0A4R2P833_9BACL|nr:DUF1189 family protein [Scopulibacillus darangshiensis]TCP31130.1 uncharacterized protein DUF1189 [Scopulibacillus darangshiensis]